MKVLVYVEGPSDRAALEVLLRPIIDAANARGVGIRFLDLRGKSYLLRDVAIKAAGHLKEHPADWVFALPDLYPMKGYEGEFAHGSAVDLVALLQRRFAAQADQRGPSSEVRTHFRAHCLKHDLEVLLLAAQDGLAARLQTRDNIHKHWRRPVEDQNDDRCPKRVVEDLFLKHRQRRYNDIMDAIWILQRATLSDIEAACPQQFAPFASALRALAEGRAPP